MSVKAKVVGKEKTAAFDRGQFTSASAAGAAAQSSTNREKRSYYYEEERRYEQREREVSESSSASSSRSASPHSTSKPAPKTRGKQPSAHPKAATGKQQSESDEDSSEEEEEVVQRARAATQLLLRGSHATAASSSNHTNTSASLSPPSTKLEAYLRGRTASVPTMTLADASLGVETLSSAPAGEAKRGAAQVQQKQQALPRTVDTSNQRRAAASSGGASPAAESSCVHGALAWQTANTEFQELMSLFGKDVQREHQVQEPTTNVVTTSKPVSENTTSSGQPSRTYAAPSRLFQSLENQALEQLYEDWCHQRQDGVQSVSGMAHEKNGPEQEGAVDAPDLFIATDHRGAAFTLAAMAARSTPASSSPPMQSSVLNAPFLWEELMQGETARRNARFANASLRPRADSDVLLSNPADVAEQATQQLHRFLQSVACVERLVSDRRFMRSVAVFLYEHHKCFLPHYQRVDTLSASPPPPPAPLQGQPIAADAEPIVEHQHGEYAVYAEFGERVSAALLSVLSHNVPGFDEAEFVQALYDTPAAFAEDDTPLSAADAALKGPQNVLSFPAWRLVLAMSDFESFFEWMMDYIYEEYHLDSAEEDESGARIAVAGSRGLRALIRSTYNRPVARDDEAAAPVVAADGAAREMANGSAAAARSPALPINAAAPTQPHSSSSSSHSAVAPQGASSGGPLRLGSALSSSGTSRLLDTPTVPAGPLSPLPAGATRVAAPVPARASLTLGSPAGAALAPPPRQFFPTPPASAEGGSRAAEGPTYRKRQTTHPGRNLPPITPSTDPLMRPNSATTEGTEAMAMATTTPTSLRLSASLPSSLHTVGPALQPSSFTTHSAHSAHASLAPTSSTSATKLRRSSRTRSSTESKTVAPAARSRSGAHGLSAVKSQSRTSSTTRAAPSAPSKAKPQKPKLKR